MKPLGLTHFSFLDLKPVEFVRLARAAGFSFVSLRFHPFASGGRHYQPKTPRETHEIRRVMEGEGIALHAVDTVAIEAGFNIDAFAPVLEAATALGAKRLTVCAEDFDRGIVASRFSRLCAVARQAGLGVDLEFLSWRGINTLQKSVELISLSGATNAAVLVDALHLDRSGGNAADVAAMPARLVRTAHLCDAPAKRPASAHGAHTEARHARLMPGTGDLDLGAFLAALPNHTALFAEVPMTRDSRPPETRAAAIFEAASALMEDIR